MFNIITTVLLLIKRMCRASGILLWRGRFGAYGKQFRFDPKGAYTYSNIFVGDYVHLGDRPTIISTIGTVHIGSHVMFGPEVTIRGGNHRIDLKGYYMDQVHEGLKRPGDDLGVVIEDDVWVGTRAVILSGVTVGRGAVVAAGAVVTKDVEPYAIVGGNPARLIRYRWSQGEISEHERMLLAGERDRHC